MRAPAGEVSNPPSPRPLRVRIREKTKEGLRTMFYVALATCIYCSSTIWDQTLDTNCMVTGPKTVADTASARSRPARNIIYGPTHQDALLRQPNTRPDEFRVLIVEPGSGTEEVRCRLLSVARSWRTRYDGKPSWSTGCAQALPRTCTWPWRTCGTRLPGGACSGWGRCAVHY
jgi:hypothetical protein